MGFPPEVQLAIAIIGGVLILFALIAFILVVYFSLQWIIQKTSLGKKGRGSTLGGKG